MSPICGKNLHMYHKTMNQLRSFFPNALYTTTRVVPAVKIVQMAGGLIKLVTNGFQALCIPSYAAVILQYTC